MTKYRSKPELVDAIQWNKDGDDPRVHLWGGHRYRISISRVDGDLWVYSGDYILTHADGSLSVMSKEEFERKYEIDGDEICLCKGHMRKFLVCQKCGTLEAIKER